MKMMIKRGFLPCFMAFVLALLCAVTAMQVDCENVKTAKAVETNAFFAEFDGFKHTANGWSNDFATEVIASSGNGEAVIKNVSCTQDTSNKSEFAKGFLKVTNGNCVLIELSANVENATITVCSAQTVYAETSSRKTDIVNANSESVSKFGAIELSETLITAESVDGVITKEVVAEVSGNADHYVCAVNSQYITKISVSGTLKNQFYSSCVLTESGKLPQTASEMFEEGRKYKFIGWVNSQYEVVDCENVLPSGEYYSVYIAVECVGARILMRKITAIDFGFNVYFSNEQIAQNVCDSEDPTISFVGSLLPANATVPMDFDLDNKVLNGKVISTSIAIHSIPQVNYATDINAKIKVSFGSTVAIDSGWLAKRSIAYVASQAFNECSETQTAEFQYEISIVQNDIPATRFSKYTLEQREVLHSFMVE